jgi:hypothetical protein
MQIDTAVSHGDWFNAWGSFGRPSVERILDEIGRAGVSKVHWRTFFGARAMYPSRLEKVYWGGEVVDRPGNEATARLAYDLRDWDQLTDAVREAKARSLRITAWYPLYEETHLQRVTTTLVERHPEHCWQTREGRVRRSKVSFAAAEVRAHKLALIEEQAAYGVDEMCLDFFRENHLFDERHGAGRPRVEVDRHGVGIYGYEPVTVEAFRDRTGRDARATPNEDPEWVQCRADQLTGFMRAMRTRLRERGVAVSVKVRSMSPVRAAYPWWEPEVAPTDSLRGSFVDWPRWVDEGLVDEVLLVLENWDLFDLDWRHVWGETERARALIGDRARLATTFFTYNMRDRSLRDGAHQLELCTEAAIRAGADAVCLWESNPLHGWGSALGGGGGVDIGLWRTVRELAARDPRAGQV